MKSIKSLIKDLETIDQTIHEKDLLLNHQQELIAMFKSLLTDPDFIKSDLYLDLRVKYLNKIDEKLKMHVPISIVEKKTKKTKKTSETSGNDAPVATDIYAAPGLRRQKPKKSSSENQKKNENVNISINIEDDDDPQYFEFEHSCQYHPLQSYYLAATPTENSQISEHKIYDDQLKLMGHLQNSTITLLNLDDLEHSEQIQLEIIQSSANMAPHEKILTNYVLMQPNNNSQ